jgi:hypothetical protein
MKAPISERARALLDDLCAQWVLATGRERRSVVLAFRDDPYDVGWTVDLTGETVLRWCDEQLASGEQV